MNPISPARPKNLAKNSVAWPCASAPSTAVRQGLRIQFSLQPFRSTRHPLQLMLLPSIQPCPFSLDSTRCPAPKTLTLLWYLLTKIVFRSAAERASYVAHETAHRCPLQSLLKTKCEHKVYAASRLIQIRPDRLQGLLLLGGCWVASDVTVAQHFSTAKIWQEGLPFFPSLRTKLHVSLSCR